MGRGKRRFALWNGTGLLGLEMREQRRFGHCCAE
jgi:hypothetical protein